ncbi:MAG: amino acid ABC transporter ATP-binding protein [Oscillospiraceae bacterium]|nr:amino acid ABC transporter ATP-binding protein [Oscillospiraceae bacterium]
MQREPILEVKHLSKTFGTNPVLKDINFDICQGDVISIIGPSGSGKSTLLRCINLLETPTAGSILFKGRNITELGKDVFSYRAKVGMVFQSFNLFDNLSVMDNCTLGQIRVLHRSREEAEEYALQILSRVGMAPYCNARPRQLSGGQKQRVAIARALITRPQIILADEPTGALDSKTSVEVMQLLKKLNQEDGMTIVVVTHESGVANETNKIVHIKDGIIGEIEENLNHDASPFGINGMMK